MADPAIDLAAFLDANLGTSTLGTNTFDGPIKPPDDGVPEEAVFFIESGGPAAEPDNGTSNKTVRATVQVLARSENHAYAAGKIWADSVFAVVEQGAVTGYVNVRNLQARPQYMGADDGKRHLWSWDAEMIFEE